jgi:hypothetical protein
VNYPVNGISPFSSGQNKYLLVATKESEVAKEKECKSGWRSSRGGNKEREWLYTRRESEGCRAREQESRGRQCGRGDATDDRGRRAIERMISDARPRHVP